MKETLLSQSRMCGIIRLTNSYTPIVTFRLFSFGIGVSLNKKALSLSAFKIKIYSYHFYDT